MPSWRQTSRGTGVAYIFILHLQNHHSVIEVILYGNHDSAIGEIRCPVFIWTTYALSAWEETPFYSDRERAALAWAEALTLIAETHAPDVLYDSVRQHFSEKERVDLSLAIVTINGWNRRAIGFRSVPGSYQPAAH